MNYVQDAFTVQVGRIMNGAFLPLLELPRTFRFFIHVLSSHSNRTKRVICDIICLFVWCFSSHARNVHSYGDVTIAGFDLCSALMSIEHWGFFKVPQLLWHGASVYNGHPEGPVTLTHIAERLAAELSLPVFTPSACRSWGSNTQPSTYEVNALTNCATVAVLWH